MNFENVKTSLVEAAKGAGLKEYEIYYMQEESISAETLEDEISAFSSSVCGGVNFRCIHNGKMGYASSELLEEDEMRALVARAMSNAENMDTETDAQIFEGSEKYNEPLGLKHQRVDAARLKQVALDLQRCTYAQSELVAMGTQSAAMASKIDVMLINSHGLELSNSLYMCGAYTDAVVKRGEDAEDEFETASGLEPEMLEEASKKAVSGAIAKLGAAQIDSGKYDIIFSGKQMRALLGTYASAFSGKQAYNGLSLLAGKEGEKVASDCITIVDDPAREGSTMQTHFDGEGVATYRKNVIENGILKTLLYDIETAKKAGCITTGNGKRSSYASSIAIAPYNFYILGGDRSLSDIITGVSKGIYITELKGLHAGANAVTGDFSLESAGFIIENGKLGGAVRSFTVAGNFFELLKNIEEISNEVDFSLPSLTAFGAPDVLVRGMSIAGK